MKPDGHAPAGREARTGAPNLKDATSGAVVHGAKMQKWEYCLVEVTLYRDGNDPGPARELLYVTMPGAHKTSVANPLGSLGLLNQLGAEGWELVDAGPRGFYMKREASTRKRGPRTLHSQ